MFKKIILSLLILFITKVGFCSISFSIQYNTGNDAFDVFVTSTISYPNFQNGISTVSVFFDPGGYNPNNGSVTASVNGGTWTLQDKGTVTVAPFVNYKFGVFLSSGGAFPLPANTPVKLFSYSFTGVGANCAGGFKQRLVTNNGTDPLDPDGLGNYDLTPFLYSATAGQLNATNSGTTFLNCTALTPLPVRFLNFTASKSGNNAVLNWNVSNEDMITKSYEVERSIDRINFSAIVTVPAKNNGSPNNSYDHTDANLSSLHADVIYYRIKQVDADGNFIYSDIRPVKVNGNGFGINIYPNPAKNYTNLTIDLPDDLPVIIRVTDAGGKEMKKIEMAGFKGTNQKTLDLSGFASGSYMIKVLAGGQSQIISLVKGE